MVVKVEAYNDGEQWCARGIGEDIFACSATLDELHTEIKDAVACHFEEHLLSGKPLSILVLTEAELSGATPAPAG